MTRRSVDPTRIAIAVHGGAFAIPPDEWEAHRLGCRRALERGRDVLLTGGSAVDAVEAAVRVMEADGTFDAGRGSYLDEHGQVSLDAGIMDGATLETGSVAGGTGIRHPVSVARRVLESPHAVIVGEGVRLFAEATGCETCDPAEMIHPRELARWKAAGGGRAGPDWAAQMFGDTVGAVALDARGNLAAATSTGGSPRKPRGRVGDSPFVGAGLFADNRSAATSTTGHGERIIPLVWAKSVADLVERGDAAPQAAVSGLRLLDRLDARGGIIVLDRNGHVGVAWNTSAMAFAAWPRGTDQIEDGPRP